MFHPHILSLLQFHFRMCKMFHCVPFRFNGEARLERITSWKHILFFKIQCWISLAYCLVQAYHLTLGTLDLAGVLQGQVFFVVYLGCFIGRWNIRLDNGGIQVLNSLMDFELVLEKEIGKKQKTMKTKGLRIIISFFETTVITYPLAIGFLVFLNPCTPPFILSMTEGCLGTDWLDVQTSWWKYGVVVFEMWMATHTLYSSTCWIFYNFCAGIACMVIYIEAVQRHMSTKGDLPVSRYLAIYRGLQVLEKTMNDFLQQTLTPTMLSIIPALQITTQYVTIVLHDVIPSPGFLIFPQLMCDAMFFNTVILTFASGLFKKSSHILEGMAKLSKKGDIRRAVKASGRMKLKYGSNYVDQGTPLVIQDFCLNQTVSLILITQTSKK